MAIRSLKTNSFSRSLLVGNAYYVPPYFDSIATVTVGSGGASYAEFTSIPSTYTHLQIRYTAQTTTGGTSSDNLWISFNSDTTYTNYRRHYLYTDGSVASAGTGQSSSTYGALGFASRAGSTSIMGAGVIDILDYTLTNKHKTIRSLSGKDSNGAGEIVFYSSMWFPSTIAAISSIKIQSEANNLAQYSSFALYGIKA